MTGDTDFDSGFRFGKESEYALPRGVLEGGGHYAIQVLVLDENGLTAVSEVLEVAVADEPSGSIQLAVARTNAQLAMRHVVYGWEEDPESPPSAAALAVDPVREYLIKAGIAMFLDHPFVGVGVGGFQPMLMGPYAEYMPAEYRAGGATLLHTHAVEVAAESGIVGLGAYAAFLATVGVILLRRMRRAVPVHRPLVGFLAAGVAIILVGGQTEGRFYDEPYLWLFIGMLAGVAAAMREGTGGWAARMQGWWRAIRAERGSLAGPPP